MIEHWKDIEGYEGIYQVSDLGNVKALAKEVAGRRYKEKHLKKTVYETGYVAISLYNNLVVKRHLLHRLVCTAFIGIIPKGMVVNHIDNNPSNNHVSNLEITTQSENIKHAFRQGRASAPMKGKYGSLHNWAKQIEAFKGGVSRGLWGSITEMKQDLGIKSNDISSVISGKRKSLGGYTFKYIN